MKKLFLLFITTYALFFACNTFSQQLTFNKVVSPIGSFNGLVGGIAQDKYGYMWFVTNGGLFRYDGYKFKLYSNDPSNPNTITAGSLETIYADKEGILWIATWISGIDRLDPATGTFTHFRHNPKNANSLSNDTVRSFLEDHEGNFWIGNNGGLDRLDRKTGKFYNYHHNPADSNSLSCNRIRKLYEDKAGTIWVGTGSAWEGEGGETDEGGLNKFNKSTGKFTRYLYNPQNPHALINNKVNAIFEDSHGVFWVGTAGDGLHTMNRTTGLFKRYLYNSAHPENLSRPLLTNVSYDYIAFINEDALGNIWIGTTTGGINSYNPKTQKVKFYGNKDSAAGFTSNSGWCSANSRDGMLWIGTWEGELYRINPFHKNIPHVFTGSTVLAFNEDSSKNVLIGTTNGFLIKNSKTGVIKKIPGIAASVNRTASDGIVIYKDNKNKFWIGVNRQLYLYNNKNNSVKKFTGNIQDSGSLAAGEIYAIKGAGDDSLWIGTSNGLDLLNTRTGIFTRFKNIPYDTTSLIRNYIQSLFTDKAGNLWIGTYFAGGLDYLARSSTVFRHFFKGISVLSVIQDSRGKFWAGTEEGLYTSIDPAKGFTKVKGLNNTVENNSFLFLFEDNNKNIWAHTPAGILKINIVNNDTKLFESNYGVRLTSLSVGSIYQAQDSKIYFNAIDGYYVVNPSELTETTTAPEIIFPAFRVNGSLVIPGKNSILNTPLEDRTNISLRYNQNVFSFEITAIHYGNPATNQLLYKLENYEPEWHEAGMEKTAYYYNVPPGDYIFKVKAASSDGAWSEKNIVITITSPWWETWWFRILSVVAVIMVIYAIIKERSRKLKAENLLLEKKVTERTAQLKKSFEDLKSTQAQLIHSEKMASLGELTAGIAHEIQNPLNFVNNFSEVNDELISELVDEVDKGNTEEVKAIATDIKQNLEKINHHGRRADAIVKGMLQHSRQTKGVKEPTDINALCDEYLRLSYYGLRAKDKEFNADFRTEFDESIGKINIVPQDMGRVLLNLFNNAFYAVNEKKKLTSASGGYQPTAEVKTRRLNDKVEITISDNGNGISPNIIDKIFQPFFTTKPTGQGTGLGLSLAYDIITKEHNGTIKVESKEGEGTIFIIQLSINYSLV